MSDERAHDGLSRRTFLSVGAASVVLAPALAHAEKPSEDELPKLRMGEVRLSLTINGTLQHVAIAPEQTLLDVLRDTLGVTSCKRGCETGSCGACTVLFDGKRVPACLIPAPLAHKRSVTTVEGLLQDGKLSPMQQAFLDHDATDCGFCTPGQVMAATAIVEEGWPSSEDALRQSLCGQACACGKKPQILSAIQQVLKQRR
ncbi:MAG TPA: (2Fe-2S)-binding protein [Pseudomonadota bacterium]|nr:(2Fe-2S)-binding protein [Pseudomonadota bacterium]